MPESRGEKSLSLARHVATFIQLLWLSENGAKVYVPDERWELQLPFKGGGMFRRVWRNQGTPDHKTNVLRRQMKEDKHQP